MSKLEDYEFRNVNQQQVDFKDDTRDLLNNGKYQASVATTGIPGWAANTGEFAFFSSGSDRRLYLRASTSWQLLAGYDPTRVPTTTKYNSSAITGTGNTFSLIDHDHGLANSGGGVSFGTPVAVDTANQAGTESTSARSDHQHLGFLQMGSMQAFTSNGTWTRPATIGRVFARVWGGGGGGASAGGGGGGAGYSEGFVTVTGNVTVTIGSGGAGGGVTGGNGTNSSFAGVTTLTAGSGGGAAQPTGGAGGTASGGTLNLSGGAGAGGGAVNGGASGSGGGSPLGGAGGGGDASNTGTGGNGAPGTVPGGGGGGGGKGSGSNGNGGTGANGLCLVYW